MGGISRIIKLNERNTAMKTKCLFLIIVIAQLSIGMANSQITPSVTRTSLSESDRTILDQQLSEYAVFTIDKRELIDSLYTKGSCRFQLCIDERCSWTIDLEFNDMRAPDFRQTYITDKGEFEFEELFIVNTFKGKTSDGQIARFTIDENTFSGIILDDKYHYEIRPAKNYTQNHTDESLIGYRSWDVISRNDNFDYINDAIEVLNDEENERTTDEGVIRNSASSYTTCTWFLRIATDADFQLYQNPGNSNLANTYRHILSVLNEVEGVYESTFNMRFIITYQNVYTTNTTYTETDSEELAKQFRNYWNNNRQSVSRNIAHLFTGKSLTNGIGRGYLGNISNPTTPITNSSAYSLSSNYSSRQHSIAAHEIGHNFNADHATQANCDCTGSNPNSNSIMCPIVSFAPDLWFCDESIAQILPFIHSKSSYLTGNISTSLTLSGSLTGFQSYEATQTITSTQVVNSGFTSYKAGNSISLKPGFQAKSGSLFTAAIEDDSECENYQPINVSSWTNAVCIGGEVRFNVTNATCYVVQIKNQWGNIVYSGNGGIAGNQVAVWNATGTGVYYITISFYSPTYKKSGTYDVSVLSCSSYAPMMPEMENDAASLQLLLDHPFDFNLYPNPNDGNFTIDLQGNTHMESYTVEIFNCFGLPVDKVYCSVNQQSINRPDLRDGVYFVRVSMGSNSVIKKLVIQ